MTDEKNFPNASDTGEIPSFNGSEKAKASDYANYFCSYAQLYHQKHMLTDHHRMAAYHSAIMGNPDIFKDKVVMDVGTGSGILAVWAAQAGARKVYAIEYTDMAKHAQTVVTANGVDNIVTVIKGAVEDIQLPIEEDNLEAETGNDDDENSKTLVVDIIISEWMGYFLLRESMLDSLIRARDKYLKKRTGLMFPSHTTMYVAPISDEEERKASAIEYTNAMQDWNDFKQTTISTYGVDMSILENDYEKEQRDYYMLSSRWTELKPEAVLTNQPAMVKHLDMVTCTLQDSRGIFAGEENSNFDFYIVANEVQCSSISGFTGWFTADFKSRTDSVGIIEAPKITNPSFLDTSPANGYTHWGQQTFYLLSKIPLLQDQITHITGSLEMTRQADNARLYNCRFSYQCSRHKIKEGENHVNDQEDPATTTNYSVGQSQLGQLLMKSALVDQVYQIP